MPMVAAIPQHSTPGVIRKTGKTMEVSKCMKILAEMDASVEAGSCFIAGFYRMSMILCISTVSQPSTSKHLMLVKAQMRPCFSSSSRLRLTMAKQARNENTPRCHSITNHKAIWMMYNLYIKYNITIYI